MNRLVAALVLGGATWGAWAADTAPAEKPTEGPVLYGETNGVVWSWKDGVKTALTDGKKALHLAGVGETELWGWSVSGSDARTFTLALPKKKDGASPEAKADAKPDPKAKTEPPPVPKFDPGVFLVPDLASRAGTWVLAVYGPETPHPRLEVLQMGLPFGDLAWDDGRVVYAVSIDSEGHWLVVGRSSDGRPWLCRNGVDQAAPEGWRGRLTVVDAATAMAAGWGGPATAAPRPLLWTNGAWSQYEPADQAAPAVYPVLGRPGEKALDLAGWQADPTSGAKKAWFLTGGAEALAKAEADGVPVAFGDGKKGAFLVVRHEADPVYTLETAEGSTPLAGLGRDDRVVGVQLEAKKPASP